MNGPFQRRRFLGLMGAGGLVAGGAVAGHIATALPSEASEALAREDTDYAPIAEGIQQVVWSVATDEPAVALTFDDGPNTAFTPRVLDMLAAVGGRATFFVVGVQVEQEHALVRRILAEGHELGNHTWAHQNPAMLTVEQTRHEIERGTEAILRVAGQPPRWYRPPRGMVTGSAVHRAHQLGQGLAMWSADRGPADDIDVEGIARHLVGQLRPGAVFDLHDGVGAASGTPPTEWPAPLIRRREAELAALPQLLAAASERGIRVVTLTDLVALGSGVIKYLGSKRRLVPLLAAVAEAVGARTALDLFTGTTRVAQALRSIGATVTAVDTARYAEVLARTYVAWDPTPAEQLDVADAIADLAALPGRPGYVTDVFCTQARYFHPDNGARIDAIRDAIARDHAGTWREPILLTSLLEAADRVDSTTGVQMAYLKQWAPRALRPLELRRPLPVTGPGGRVIRGDAVVEAGRAGPVDLAYLDPPYNQHRYFTNYHVWETLVAWDQPAHYGVACKRLDARDPSTASDFNRRRRMPGALQACIDAVDSRVVVVSYNDEAWLSLDDLAGMVEARGPAIVLAVDSKRYVGAQIGIHDPAGRKVGTVSHLRNTEYVVVSGALTAGERAAVERAASHHGARSVTGATLGP